MRKPWVACAISLLCLSYPARISGQSLGNAGTIDGTVVDQSGAALQRAVITLHNAVTGYSQSVVAASDGAFRLVNIPPNQYHLEAAASSFKTFTQDVTIRNSVPVQVKATLAVAGSNTTINVEAMGADMLETDPSAHVAADRTLIMKLPVADPAGGLSQAIV
jgi:hypothetical protein